MPPRRVGGTYCQKESTGGQWTLKESNLHINVLELLAIKIFLLTFSKIFNLKSVHFQVDNMSALSYLMKMGGGGYANQGDDSHYQRDLGICIVQRDHAYCRVPAGQIKRQGRLGFQKFSRLERMSTICRSIPRNL